MWVLALAAAAGAALMYLLDPDQGRRRRAMARDQLFGTARRTGRQAARAGRRVTAQASGVTQKAMHLRPEQKPPPDDVTLARKVESELFRDPDVPKGQININVQEGVVVLRGELDRPEQIQEIEAAARKVQGVRDVENLLHLRGTPAPGTAAARETETAPRAREVSQ